MDESEWQSSSGTFDPPPPLAFKSAYPRHSASILSPVCQLVLVVNIYILGIQPSLSCTWLHRWRLCWGLRRSPCLHECSASDLPVAERPLDSWRPRFLCSLSSSALPLQLITVTPAWPGVRSAVRCAPCCRAHRDLMPSSLIIFDSSYTSHKSCLIEPWGWCQLFICPRRER